MLADLPPKGKDEVNKINMELVHQLKANDSAFSLGFTSDNLACARFGLIAEDTDMEELLGLVYTTGKEIEESSRVCITSFYNLLALALVGNSHVKGGSRLLEITH